MKVRHSEGVAIHIGPEPCIVDREVRDEASVGERTGQPLSHERWKSRVPTLSKRRKATRSGAPSQAPARPGVVGEPGMCARSLRGNREISGLTSGDTALARIGKAKSRSR